MKKTLGLLILSWALSATLACGALAETHLRVGLAEDPDVLDPSLARTYVGRIVFSSRRRAARRRGRQVQPRPPSHDEGLVP